MVALQYTWLLVLIGIAVSVEGQTPCADIDPLACRALQADRPDMCTDRNFAISVCPRFCNFCPMTCYQCNTSITDYNTCTTTVRCQHGEICMLKEIHSIVDNHAEYQMTCETKQRCDGAALSFVGKRDVTRRDLTVSCCQEDLCNLPGHINTHPPTAVSSTVPTAWSSTVPTTGSSTVPTTGKEATTTTTTTPSMTTSTSAVCMKDIIILVEDSRKMHDTQHGLKDFLTDLVHHLDIDQSASLVSMTTYWGTVHRRWDLDSHTSQSELLHAIDKIHLNGHSGNVDTEEAVQFVTDLVTTGHYGDRPRVEDVVMFIRATDSRLSTHSAPLVHQLHTVTDEVIVINWRYDDHEHLIATDINHEVYISNSNSQQSIREQVIRLICQ